MKKLALPLTGSDNRCIRDALGNVVSIPEHAEAFAHTMNMHQRLMNVVGGFLKVSMTPMDLGHVVEQLDNATKTFQEASAIKLPSAPPEVTEEQLVTIMATDQWAKKYPDGPTWDEAWKAAKLDAHHDAHHFQRKARISAQAILAACRVYPR